jgi:hypothetical protein
MYNNQVFKRVNNITTDLVAGDVNIREKVLVAGNSSVSKRYNMHATGIMVVKATAAIVAVKMALVGSEDVIETFYLNCNQIYNLAPSLIVKTGTTTETILIIGEDA